MRTIVRATRVGGEEAETPEYLCTLDDGTQYATSEKWCVNVQTKQTHRGLRGLPPEHAEVLRDYLYDEIVPDLATDRPLWVAAMGDEPSP